MKKLIRNHIWVSLPNQRNISYLGITDYAKNYFLRFHKIDHVRFFKTNYGMEMKNRISYFLEQIKQSQSIQNQSMNLSKMLNAQTSPKSANIDYSKLCLSQQIQYDRFAIRRDQTFSQINSIQFDIELSAPVELRIMDINFEVQYEQKIYQADWIYQVQILDNKQMQDRNGLMTEEQYQKSPKFMPYAGLQI